jgi:cyclase
MKTKIISAALLMLAGFGFAPSPADAQYNEQLPIEIKQIADDLYFFYDYGGSNSVFLVTDEGVLVVDTRQHPRKADELIRRIREVTDKPIKWVINSQFHGDHTFGNASFQAEGATFVTQEKNVAMMEQVHAHELQRRQPYFERNNFDPNEVELILADVTFDTKMTIRLGGREVQLLYLGPGQQDGETFVFFPHANALYTPGSFAKHSMPNMAFTRSVEDWLAMLDRLEAMDVGVLLPSHGDVANDADVRELSAMLRDEYTTVKDAIDRGVNLEEAKRTLTFPQYSDWRNYSRLEGEIEALYELIQTGERSYFE